MSSPLEVVTTERLVLRRMIEGDWVALRSIDADAVATSTLGGLRTELETQAYVFAQVEHWARHGFGWWTATDRATGSFVGRGGLRSLTLEARPAIEVGYAIVRERWGAGLATELARAAVEAADRWLAAPRLVAVTLPDNRASRRVLEKVGFAYVRDVEHASLPHVLYERARTGGMRATRSTGEDG